MDRIVAPVLPSLTQQLSEDLLFRALWERVLNDPERCLLVRATVLRRPGDRTILRALANADDAPDTAIERLRASSLLTEMEDRRFEVHPSVAQLARQHASNIDTLLEEGHHLAGTTLEEIARQSRYWDDGLEAAYHLNEVGEADRAFDLLLGHIEWLNGRGRFLDSLASLELLSEPEALSLQNQARLLLIKSDIKIGLGNLASALPDVQAAIVMGKQLAQQDTTNTQWQRDLSVSHNKIGDIFLAQGNLDDALSAYRDSLAIAEPLAQQDTTNTQWQTDLVVSYWKIAQLNVDFAEMPFDRESLLQNGLAILYRLQNESRLTHQQQEWVPALEQALEQAKQPPSSGILASIRTIWHKFISWW